ncbi:hypothetical protein C8R46DRAFT_1215340 [Mycena filopes]|nr:hypothetical protein C8R46DRAFT_1215340 [Mycena filopes]
MSHKPTAQELFREGASKPGNEDRFDSEEFKRRLKAVETFVDAAREVEEAFAVVCGFRVDASLPATVLRALDEELNRGRRHLENINPSFLPCPTSVGYHEDDEDAPTLYELHAVYPKGRYHSTATKCFIRAVIYLLSGRPPLHFKFRLPSASAVVLVDYPVPKGCKSWLEFQHFSPITDRYEPSGGPTSMDGRGRIMIYRKNGLQSVECPYIEKWEATARQSADEEPYSRPSDASSPLPPSSPPPDSSIELPAAPIANLEPRAETAAEPAAAALPAAPPAAPIADLEPHAGAAEPASPALPAAPPAAPADLEPHAGAAEPASPALPAAPPAAPADLEPHAGAAEPASPALPAAPPAAPADLEPHAGAAEPAPPALPAAPPIAAPPAPADLEPHAGAAEPAPPALPAAAPAPPIADLEPRAGAADRERPAPPTAGPSNAKSATAQKRKRESVEVEGSQKRVKKVWENSYDTAYLVEDKEVWENDYNTAYRISD